MEVLELKPIKDKKISLYLIEKENKELSNAEHENLLALLRKQKFNFTTIDLSDDDLKKIYLTPLAQFFDNFGIPYYYVNIPDYAKMHLLNEISDKKEQIEELQEEYEKLCSESAEKESFKSQNLNSWIHLLKSEIEDKENHLNLKLRPLWIVKKILDIIKMINDDEINIIHFTRKELFSELKKLFEVQNIKVINFESNKIMKKNSILISI